MRPGCFSQRGWAFRSLPPKLGRLVDATPEHDPSEKMYRLAHLPPLSEEPSPAPEAVSYEARAIHRIFLSRWAFKALGGSCVRS